MRFKCIIITGILLAAATISSKAQFYSSGNDPGSLRWKYITTPNYKIIFPKGLDSLAKVYASELETSRPKVALSSGYRPGEKYWSRTPVVLHAYTGSANGSVAWAPMRMDLYTLPDAYSPEPMPWVKELSIHENRHVAQLQFGADGVLKPFSWIFGEMATGAFSGLFPGTWMLEGDAVVAETALSDFGRGRSASFLAYYKAAFDKGDRRSWTQWRWGSSRRYAPDHYALGYLTVAGARYLYNDPLFTSDFLSLSAKRPLKASKVRAWFKNNSGKHFYDAFQDICDSFSSLWARNAIERGEAFSGTSITGKPDWYTVYRSPVCFGNDVYAIKSSLVRPSGLVKISPDGKETAVRAFASKTSPIIKAGDKLYWTETIPDKRWTLAADSRLMEMSGDGRIKELSKKGRYYNPAISPDGNISVTEYPFKGGSAVVVLSPEGKILRRLEAPHGYQITESAWLGDSLAVAYIGPEGFGIGYLDGNEISQIIPQGPYSINHLKVNDGKLYFISDRNGVEEIYCCNGNETLQISASEYGITDFAIEDGRLIWTARQYEGELLHKALLSDMPAKEATFLSWHRDAVADTLSAQEERLAEDAGVDLTSTWDGRISEPKAYSKLLNAIRIHSWVPLGIKYDSVSDISGDSSLEEISLGATLLFQNTLGTLSGLASYSYGKDELTADKWRNSFHLSLAYSGLYPVFEVLFDAGTRNAIQYGRVLAEYNDLRWEQTRGRLMDSPYLKAEIKAYVPLNFSKGGWTRGLIPQIEYIISNDRFLTGAPVYSYGSDLGEIQTTPVFKGYTGGKNVPLQTVTASLRAYSIRNTASSQVYPCIGIGAELGYRQRLALSEYFSPDFYWYLYGYLPGLKADHGLRLTALGQHQFDAVRFESAVKTRPRGLASDALNNWMSAYAPSQIRLTADYAIPFCYCDFDRLSPLAYIKNFVLTPHVDYTFLWFDHGYSGYGGLSSIGLDLTAKVANILWFPYGSEIGLSFCYNGGPSFSDIKAAGVPMKRTSVGMVFKTSF